MSGYCSMGSPMIEIRPTSTMTMASEMAKIGRETKNFSIGLPFFETLARLLRSGGLRQRVLQYVKYGWGTAVNHKGGRAIWQVKDYPLLLLEYEVCENCEQREHELLADYKKENGTYPLANWRG